MNAVNQHLANPLYRPVQKVEFRQVHDQLPERAIGSVVFIDQFFWVYVGLLSVPESKDPSGSGRIFEAVQLVELVRLDHPIDEHLDFDDQVSFARRVTVDRFLEMPVVGIMEPKYLRKMPKKLNPPGAYVGRN